MGRKRRLQAGLLVVALTVALVSAGAVASEETPRDRHGSDRSVIIADRHIEISDVAITSDGLPSITLDERTIEVDSATASVDGVTLTTEETTYRIGQMTVGLENVGLTVGNISIGSS